ncbi:lectin C-type domain protein, partial [Ancylostoma duodenale]
PLRTARVTAYQQVELVLEPMDYRNATRACRSAGGNLVSIHSNEHNSMIYDMVECNKSTHREDGCAWIGMSWRNKTRRWRWDDGTKKWYTKWTRGEPSDMCCGNPRLCIG